MLGCHFKGAERCKDGILMWARASLRRMHEAEHVYCVVSQALKAAEEAEAGWEADTADSRKAAIESTQQAADFAQQTYKHLRLVHTA